MIRLGPQVGLRLLTWVRDEDAWESWPAVAGTQRITPDGYALVHVDHHDQAVPLLVEVDRATMPLGRLREKALRYLRYTAAGVWQDRHPMCPVLLMLTTSDNRAVNVLAAVADERGRVLGPTGDLLVAVSGSVDKADDAVTVPVWRSDHGDSTVAEQQTPARTLTDLLCYRISTEQRRHAAERAAQAARDIEEVRALARRLVQRRRGYRPRYGDDPRVAQVLAALLDRDDARICAWAVGNPAVIRQLDEALGQPDQSLSAEAARTIAAMHPALLAQQIRAARGAVTAATVDDPRLRDAAQSLAHQWLVPGRVLDDLTAPRSFTHLQAELLAGYLSRRDEAVAATLAQHRRGRARGRPRLLAEYDLEHLKTCLTCGLHHDEPEPIELPARLASCRGCGGVLGDYDPARPDRIRATVREFLDAGDDSP